MKAKMNTKNLMVSFCTVAIFLFLIGLTTAATSAITTDYSVEINGLEELGNEDISVIAGETLTVKVFFTSLEDASNVRLEAELQGTKMDVDEKTSFFDVEEDKRYVKTVKLQIPYELNDDVSDDLELNVRLWNSEFSTEFPQYTLRVQRPSYNADILSISVNQVAEAGEILPVDVVVKNIGYNELDDLYVKLSIPELGLEKTAYFGDIIEVENDDYDDYVRGKFYLRIPYEAPEGIYTIQVEAMNDDLEVSAVKQIIIKNDFSEGNVIVTHYRQVASVGENAEYSMLIVNPTNKLKVYTIITESSSENLHTSSSSTLVSVPAGLSKSVTITANAAKQGEYTFNVNVLSGNELESVVTYNLSAEGRSSNPIAVLTVILAIIFLVLLVVLIVLIGKKPQKSEEFGESYY